MRKRERESGAAKSGLWQFRGAKELTLWAPSGGPRGPLTRGVIIWPCSSPHRASPALRLLACPSPENSCSDLLDSRKRRPNFASCPLTHPPGRGLLTGATGLAFPKSRPLTNSTATVPAGRPTFPQGAPRVGGTAGTPGETQRQGQESRYRRAGVRLWSRVSPRRATTWCAELSSLPPRGRRLRGSADRGALGAGGRITWRGVAPERDVASPAPPGQRGVLKSPATPTRPRPRPALPGRAPRTSHARARQGHVAAGAGQSSLGWLGRAGGRG